MNSPRVQSIILTFVYMFVPMLLIVQPSANTAQSLNIDELAFMNILDGKGGPDENLIAIESNTETNDLSLNEEEESNSFTVTTKTINYLKVANTSMPVDNPEVSSNYGWRSAPCGGCSSNHQGIDFVPGYGEPVMAVADGMVIDMGRNGGYGNFVRISHLVTNSDGELENWETLYAHMKNDSFPEGLRIGSAVKVGEEIGAVGSTGMSTGPHLHFELLINNENVDPLPLLGTYQVLTVTEEEYDDYMFNGETFKVVESITSYQ